MDSRTKIRARDRKMTKFVSKVDEPTEPITFSMEARHQETVLGLDPGMVRVKAFA